MSRELQQIRQAWSSERQKVRTSARGLAGTWLTALVCQESSVLKKQFLIDEEFKELKERQRLFDIMNMQEQSAKDSAAAAPDVEQARERETVERARPQRMQPSKQDVSKENILGSLGSFGGITMPSHEREAEAAAGKEQDDKSDDAVTKLDKIFNHPKGFSSSPALLECLFSSSSSSSSSRRPQFRLLPNLLPRLLEQQAHNPASAGCDKQVTIVLLSPPAAQSAPQGSEQEAGCEARGGSLLRLGAPGRCERAGQAVRRASPLVVDGTSG
eukprot:747151-Hanusia_phi.AAC.2